MVAGHPGRHQRLSHTAAPYSHGARARAPAPLPRARAARRPQPVRAVPRAPPRAARRCAYRARLQPHRRHARACCARATARCCGACPDLRAPPGRPYTWCQPRVTLLAGRVPAPECASRAAQCTCRRAPALPATRYDRCIATRQAEPVTSSRALRGGGRACGVATQGEWRWLAGRPSAGDGGAGRVSEAGALERRSANVCAQRITFAKEARLRTSEASTAA